MRNPSTSSSTAAATTTTTTTTNTTNKTPCCSKVGLKRGPWTPEEDELLASYIKKEGEGRWRTLPKRAGLLRCGKSCRLRWMNYLRPSVKRGQIAPDEEDLILRLHRLLGNRWSLIAGRIPGRTDNEIKNYWNTHLSKKLISQGIDPRTHKPLDQSNVNNPPDHQANKASSSKANRSSSSSKLNNNNPSSSDMEDDNNATRSNKLTLINMESGYVENTSLDDEYHQRDGIMTGHGHGHINGYTSLLNCDDSAVVGLRSGNVHQGLSNEEDEDINYCADDVFSSFLNSLINEEAFSSHNQLQQQQQQPSGIAALSVPCSDPLVSITASTFGLGASWESPIMSSAFNQNEHSKRVVNDHVE